MYRCDNITNKFSIFLVKLNDGDDDDDKMSPLTRNTLDCDQSNVYSSRVVFSAIS